MSTSAGPNISLDGLVFGYDTGYPSADNETSLRFNKGEPVTNLFTTVGDASNVDQNVTFSVNGTGTFKRVAIGTEIGDYKVKDTDVVYSYELGTNGCHYHGNDYSSVSSGTKVSFSIEYFLTSDVSIVRNYLGNFEQLSGVGGSWGSVNSQTGVWHKVSFTRTATSTGNLRMLMYPGACGGSTLSNQGKIYYKNPTVTLTDHNVPFVSGIRSSTQGLLDLAGTTEIDLTNVSFDSNAQLTFDGTDDGINLGDNEIFDFTNGVATIEAIVKFPSSWTGGSQYPNLISKGGSAGWDTDGWALFGFRDWPSAGQKSWGLGFRNGSTSRTVYIANRATDVYLHIVATTDGSTMRLYENGVQVSTQSQTINPASNSTNVYLGRGPSSQFFPGELPISKVYNITLSADEIKQNFNAYKKRFGI
jgi:hypothetical protein